ncbi:MAG: hypothetical protein VYE22_36350 [Myxococcota bacterium]|nr:hypothetical protein [Myxococcota bacterium]
MTTHLHIASGRATSLVFDEALIEEARTHAAESSGGRAEEASNREQLLEILGRHLRDGAQLRYLDFHTHGGPGRLDIGAYPFSDWEELAQFSGLMAGGARIEFHGCAVADTPRGELFLARCAWFMLRARGGLARGWTEVSLATHAVVGDMLGTVPWHMGHEVRARVSPGGHVRLEGERYLNVESASRALAALRRDARRALGRGETRRHATTVLEQTASLEGTLRGSPSFTALHRVWDRVQMFRAFVPARTVPGQLPRR